LETLNYLEYKLLVYLIADSDQVGPNQDARLIVM